MINALVLGLLIGNLMWNTNANAEIITVCLGIIFVLIEGIGYAYRVEAAKNNRREE